MKVEDIEKVAVVGFGRGPMGRHIAQLFAQYGYSVFAVGREEESMKLGLQEIEKGRFGLQAAVERGKITEEQAESALARIKLTTNMTEACKDVDFVVEAVYEDLDLKKKTFKELDTLCPQNIVLATNTSTFSITEIASATEGQDRVIGMHFFNPPHIMRLVEIIRGLLTSEETNELTKNLAMNLGKTPIIIKDSPGFGVNRLGFMLFLEASKLLEEGVASIRDIDIGMRLGYGHPVGPFELVDIVGLDARLRNYEAMYKQTNDPRWSPPRLLRQLVSAGYLGDPKVKPGSKGGYYEYSKMSRPEIGR